MAQVISYFEESRLALVIRGIRNDPNHTPLAPEDHYGIPLTTSFNSREDNGVPEIKINPVELGTAIASAFPSKNAVLRFFGGKPFEIDLLALYPNDGYLDLAINGVREWTSQDDSTPVLIRELLTRKPGNTELRKACSAYVNAVFDDVWKQQVTNAQQSFYNQYFGGKPPIHLIQNEPNGASAEVIVPADGPGFENIVRVELGFLDVGAWLRDFELQTRRVCRVECPTKMGTGFLVGKDTVLTNYHVLEDVINDPASASQVIFRFDYMSEPTGVTRQGTEVRLSKRDEESWEDKKWLLSQSPYSRGEDQRKPDTPPEPDQLDYALVRLRENVGSERGWIQVPEKQELPAKMDQLRGKLPMLLILQHPQLEPGQQSKPLMLALDTDAKVQLIHDGLRLRYRTNTANGSSGSPCFDKQWNLVALHHYGDPAWRSKANGEDWNQGIPIGRIREHLGAHGAENALGGRA